jgi:hypothetical protein
MSRYIVPYMAYGPPICAACGGSSSIQKHHIVPRVYGGIDLPTVWLCDDCHGKAHCTKPKDVSALTRAGLKLARERGILLGRRPTVGLYRETIAALMHDGLSPLQISEQLKLNRSSVYRLIAEIRTVVGWEIGGCQSESLDTVVTIS